MDFAKKSGDLFFIYWLAVHILRLVHVITEIVLVTGAFCATMGYAL